jgi:hypothetical protein
VSRPLYNTVVFITCCSMYWCADIERVETAMFSANVQKWRGTVLRHLLGRPETCASCWRFDSGVEGLEAVSMKSASVCAYSSKDYTAWGKAGATNCRALRSGTYCYPNVWKCVTMDVMWVMCYVVSKLHGACLEIWFSVGAIDLQVTECVLWKLWRG